MNCVAASELPDVKGFRGSIDPYVVIKWDGKEVKRSQNSTNNQKPRFDTVCRIDVRDAEETAALVVELYDKQPDGGDTHVSSIEIGLEELIEFCEDGNKKPRTMAFTGVPGSKEFWSEGLLKIVLRDGKEVKFTKEEKKEMKMEAAAAEKAAAKAAKAAAKAAKKAARDIQKEENKQFALFSPMTYKRKILESKKKKEEATQNLNSD